MSTRVVAIDGGGGAGKSTLAGQLAEELQGAPVIHTDDFASWEENLTWWPRLLAQVLVPLSEGRPARYQRYDWNARRLAEWIRLPNRPDIVLLEGVSAMRLEFEPYLALRIWVETPRELRLRRGIERDGEELRSYWDAWMLSEDAHVAADQPVGRADFVVSGAA